VEVEMLVIRETFNFLAVVEMVVLGEGETFMSFKAEIDVIDILI
jgi:hypothetical protein